MNQVVLHNTINKPYKVYRALLKLSTSVSATVLENTLGEAVTWTYNTVVSPNGGRYIGTCTLFDVETTHVLFNKGYDSEYTTSSEAFISDTPNKVEITNYNKSDAGVITHIPINNEDFWSYIEIKVYY
jgi:hypothetical protein